MGSTTDPVKITIVHFNDVYNIEARTQEPVGGAARFVTAIKEQQHLNPLVLFSGDAFNPSVMSAVTKGKQMVPVLNACNVCCAVYGNHDFDFGVDTLVKLANETNFPWLISNVTDQLNDCILANGILSHMVEWQGKKIGIVGLVEEEWIATLSCIDPEDLEFEDFVEKGSALAKELRQNGADYVIALTHMRWPNDEKLAMEGKGIDLILGGHDHDYGIKQVNGIYILKSGTDFREFSVVTLSFEDDGKVNVNTEKVTIDSSVVENPAVKEVVGKFEEIMGAKMQNILGVMDVELEGRFRYIRTRETNLGNFVTDIMLEATDADCAMLNSGTLRSDALHPKGEFRVKDLLSILPMVDPIVVVVVTGEQLRQALENSVCEYPKLEGRFAQVSGMSFGFDPTKPPGQRVDPSYIMVQGQYIKLKKMYRVAMKHYMAMGKDGFNVFKDCKQLVDEEKGPRLSIIVQNHFSSVRVLKGEKQPKFGHRQSLVSLSRRKTLVRQMTLPEQTSNYALKLHQSLPNTARSRRELYRKRHNSVDSIEFESAATALSPQVEGRIFILNDENRRRVEEQKLFSDMSHMVIREESGSRPNTPPPAQLTTKDNTKTAHSDTAVSDM